MKKKEKRVSDINFQHVDGCRYTYSTYRPCQYGSDCCKDDYCRCGIIEEMEVTKPPTMESVVESVCEVLGIEDELDRYAVNRILTFHKAYETSCYEVRKQGGYYGEEIDGVYFESSKIESDLEDYEEKP